MEGITRRLGAEMERNGRDEHQKSFVLPKKEQRRKIGGRKFPRALNNVEFENQIEARKKGKEKEKNKVQDKRSKERR